MHNEKGESVGQSTGFDSQGRGENKEQQGRTTRSRLAFSGGMQTRSVGAETDHQLVFERLFLVHTVQCLDRNMITALADLALTDPLSDLRGLESHRMSCRQPLAVPEHNVQK